LAHGIAAIVWVALVAAALVYMTGNMVYADLGYSSIMWIIANFTEGVVDGISYIYDPYIYPYLWKYWWRFVPKSGPQYGYYTTYTSVY